MTVSAEQLDWSWTEHSPAFATQRQGLALFSRRGGMWPSVRGEYGVVFTPTGVRTAALFAITTVGRLDHGHTVLNSVGFSLSQKLLAIDCVRAVYYHFDEEHTTLSVWTILQEANETNRRKVYAKELELLDELPSFVFNFRTTDKSGEDIPASSDYRCLHRDQPAS